MTIKVTITHEDINYPKNIRIVHIDHNGELINAVLNKELKAGESGEFWVHSTQKLVVEEV